MFYNLKKKGLSLNQANAWTIFFLFPSNTFSVIVCKG